MDLFGLTAVVIINYITPFYVFKTHLMLVSCIIYKLRCFVIGFPPSVVAVLVRVDVSSTSSCRVLHWLLNCCSQGPRSHPPEVNSAASLRVRSRISSSRSIPFVITILVYLTLQRTCTDLWFLLLSPCRCCCRSSRMSSS